MRLCRVLQGAGRAQARLSPGLHRRLCDRRRFRPRRRADANADHHARRSALRLPLPARSGRITVKELRPMRRGCFALVVLWVIAARADAAAIDWQAEFQRCRALRETMTPLL